MIRHSKSFFFFFGGGGVQFLVLRKSSLRVITNKQIDGFCLEFFAKSMKTAIASYFRLEDIIKKNCVWGGGRRNFDFFFGFCEAVFSSTALPKKPSDCFKMMG